MLQSVCFLAANLDLRFVFWQVSYNQLIGRSIGVCQTLQGGQCYGLIPYCCSITSDTIPASEVFVDAITNTQMGGGGFGFGNNGFLGGQGL